MNIGIHVSTSGGLDKAIDRTTELGCNAFQVFVSNPRGWKSTLLDEGTIDLFLEKYKSAQIKNAVSHSIYLINLASPRPELRQESSQSLLSDLQKTARLHLDGLVTHIGSHQGDGLMIGLERVSEALKEILDKDIQTDLLLENTAGAGTLIGKNFSEIGEIFDLVKSDRLGVCLDTAHAFESGYEINTEKGLDDLVKEIDHKVGLKRLKVIHLNDSMTSLGSNRDRHEEFGEGCIGLEAMIRIINHPSLRDKPFIMETPKLKSGTEGKEFIMTIKSYVR